MAGPTTAVPPAAPHTRLRRPDRAPVKPWDVVRHAVAAVVGLIFLAPLLWTVLTSVSRDQDVFRFPPRLWPAWNFDNYARAWQAQPWPRYFFNTIFVAGCVVALVLTTSLLAGFAFAIMRFRGQRMLFLLVMAVMMVPHTVLLIPNFIIARHLGLYDTYAIQILPWAASVFGIFLLRQFFTTLPVELFEAAELEGAGPIRMLFSIAAPLAKPSMALVALNTFMGSWNAFVWPFLMTKSAEVRPVEVGLQILSRAEGTDWTALCAAVVFTTMPVVVVFLFLQRYFVQGVYGTEGAVRG